MGAAFSKSAAPAVGHMTCPKTTRCAGGKWKCCRRPATNGEKVKAEGKTIEQYLTEYYATETAKHEPEDVYVEIAFKAPNGKWVKNIEEAGVFLQTAKTNHVSVSDLIESGWINPHEEDK